MLHDSNKYVKTLKSTVDKMPTDEYNLKFAQTRRREENTNDGTMLQCQMTSELLLWGKNSRQETSFCIHEMIPCDGSMSCTGPIGLYRDVWIAAIASSRTRVTTLSGVKCNTSQ